MKMKFFLLAGIASLALVSCGSKSKDYETVNVVEFADTTEVVQESAAVEPEETQAPEQSVQTDSASDAER